MNQEEVGDTLLCEGIYQLRTKAPFMLIRVTIGWKEGAGVIDLSKTREEERRQRENKGESPTEEKDTNLCG